MLDECYADRFARSPLGSSRDACESGGRQIEAREQRGQVAFVERRIFEQRDESGFVGLMQQCLSETRLSRRSRISARSAAFSAIYAFRLPNFIAIRAAASAGFIGRTITLAFGATR